MLRVEIADTPFKQANGLMFRKSMPDDSGMIFIFKKAENLRFWGVNTYIPLDIAFVNEDNEITQISSITPLSDKSVESKAKCCIAIEANIGYFDKNKIHVGQKISFDKITERIGSIDFVKNDFRNKTAQFVGQTGTDPQRQPIIPNDNQQGPEISPDKIQPEVQNNDNGLPVIDISNLEGILEDSYDDKDEPSQEDMIVPDDGEQPEISPDNQQEPQEEEIPQDDEYPEFGSPAEALTWAQQNREVVHIWYTTKKGRDIKRNVEPHGQFVADTTGNPIVVTFDETIGDIRAFIVPHVLHYSFVGNQFQPKFVVRG